MREESRGRSSLSQFEQEGSSDLIAWEGDQPVGHVNLRLRGRKLPDRARRLNAAQIEDLRVSREHRRRGVARKLMQRAATEAAAHGFHTVGLGVDIGNTPARRLYFAEGYEESGTGQFVVTATGMATEVGHISNLLASEEEATTPLTRQLSKLTTQILFISPPFLPWEMTPQM